MSDLRERLAKIEALGEFDAWSRTDEILDAAEAAVAEWLRQKAAETRGVADVLPATDEREAIGAAKMLDSLADSLTRKEPTDEW